MNKPINPQAAASAEPDQLDRVMASRRGMTAPAAKQASPWGKEPTAEEQAVAEREAADAQAHATNAVAVWRGATGRAAERNHHDSSPLHAAPRRGVRHVTAASPIE